jgi:hypothetical protein
MKITGLAAMCFLAGVAGYAQTGNGTLTGQVLDEKQRPVHGARVEISLVPVGKGAFAPFQAHQFTTATGGFSFSLAAGSYQVCAELPKSDLLNPCVWGKPGQTAVTAGKTTAMAATVLKRGYPLTVQLADPKGALAQFGGKATPNVVVVGVSAPDGMFHPMPVRQNNGALREHVMVVPRDLALAVTVHSNGFDLLDGTGKAIAFGQPYRFTAKIAGEKSPSWFGFTVNGVHQGN